MTTINVNLSDPVYTLVDPTQEATVNAEMFGGILVDCHTGEAAGFEDSISYLGLTNIRFPGGALSENGSIYTANSGSVLASTNGGEQEAWMNGEQSTWNYAYDLEYPDLINPALLTNDSGIIGLTEAIQIANENHASIEVILPTVRYVDYDGDLTAEEEASLLSRAYDDALNFMNSLLVKESYGTPPSMTILDIGNENLVWMVSFDGEVLPAGSKFDPAAVNFGITNYFSVATAMLQAAEDFRDVHPEDSFKMAIQVPFMNNQPGTTDPFDVFMKGLKSLDTELLAQVDIIRFHALDESFSYSADYENWFYDELVAYASIVNEARKECGISTPVEFAVDAWSTTGQDYGSAGTTTPEQSLQAAAATVALFSSLVEVGADYASAWGISIDYRADVQLSYYDPETGQTYYTPNGEVVRQMSESLPGTTLINCAGYIDADRTGLVNIQVFADSSKIVIFLSANDIPDGDSNDKGAGGESVTINLASLDSAIGYAWGETITCANGSSGNAVVWNPATDTSAKEKGELPLSFGPSSVTATLTSDYEIVRLEISLSAPGQSPLTLLGDSRILSGKCNDSMVGGAGSDSIVGLTGVDSIFGNGGNDTIYGDGTSSLIGGVEDYIRSGSGNDLAHGGEGNDTIYGDSGTDTLYGDGGDDSIFVSSKASFAYGGGGVDTLIFQSGSEGVVANLSSGKSSSGVVFSGFEAVVGSNKSDSLTGGSGSDTLSGMGSSDSLSGWNGNDRLESGDGNDYCWGGSGNDSLVGGSGQDYLTGDDGSDIITGGTGIDTIFGGNGNDAYRYAGAADGGDYLKDFSGQANNSDIFKISASGFGLHLSAGWLNEDNFHSGKSNTGSDSDDYFIYRTTDATLWCDPDGAEGASPILIAHLPSGTVLDAGDILIF